ncbi:hypothetical protein M427DRAFT_363734 [Gonapodya prolifera JEL478]|uniref:Uncharacterized protein n=1 Tax=Gonapodya prolifera (strain JEL478) TaxID=1344416 RepID=A0A139AAE9_GONPJ|nr:hypothetical protein M427DRAFT_363734 [Gonapodya prolifera JEL478]|eukprot:KXS13781.1 hypothetical protein M427DRAFT_363734 [Gonapodya prolifera JEL478]
MKRRRFSWRAVLEYLSDRRRYEPLHQQTETPMPLIDNLLPFTLWVLSILIFPTSLASIMVLYENKSWCFADECLEGKAVHRTPIRALAGIFYGYLLLTAIVAIAARVSAVRDILH